MRSGGRVPAPATLPPGHPPRGRDHPAGPLTRAPAPRAPVRAASSAQGRASPAQRRGRAPPPRAGKFPGPARPPRARGSASAARSAHREQEAAPRAECVLAGRSLVTRSPRHTPPPAGEGGPTGVPGRGVLGGGPGRGPLEGCQRRGTLEGCHRKGVLGGGPGREARGGGPTRSALTVLPASGQCDPRTGGGVGPFQPRSWESYSRRLSCVRLPGRRKAAARGGAGAASWPAGSLRTIEPFLCAETRHHHFQPNHSHPYPGPRAAAGWTAP